MNRPINRYNNCSKYIPLERMAWPNSECYKKNTTFLHLQLARIVQSTQTLHVVQLFRRRKSLIKPVTWQKTCNYNVLFGFHPRSVMNDEYVGGCSEITLSMSCMTISGGRTEQLIIIAGFLPCHWLYKWFSQFYSCGTYSVLSWSPSFVIKA